MNAQIIPAVVLVGFSAGLRTFTAPATLAWAVFTGCISVAGTPFEFLASHTVLVLVSLAALGEYVFDLLPFAPPRTEAPALIGRFATGTFSAAVLLAVGGHLLIVSVAGGLAAIGGAFVGFAARTRLVNKLNVPDALIAIPEDLVAIGVAAVAAALAAQG